MTSSAGPLRDLRALRGEGDWPVRPPLAVRRPSPPAPLPEGEGRQKDGLELTLRLIKRYWDGDRHLEDSEPVPIPAPFGIASDRAFHLAAFFVALGLASSALARWAASS